ncbi:MAG TPA: hypothetical protein PKD64_18640 [Pirellulaceae bacterium]|nr:hypothetical protein [Pirellulaceae bacterium]HMO94209.1 hypothetical protein [Pirellulaceae bacterium]
MDESMLTWLLGDNVTGKNFRELLAISKFDKRLEQYQSLACVGFAASAGELPDNLESLVATSLDYHAGRKPFSGNTPMRFCSDSVGLLGIVLACKHANNERITQRVNEWLGEFLPTVLRSTSLGQLDHDLLNAVFFIARGHGDTSSISPHIQLALQHKGLLPVVEANQQSILKTAVLVKAKSDNLHNLAEIEKALLLYALDVASSTSTIQFSQPSLAELVLLLSRVPSSLKRWTWEEKPLTSRSVTRKWHIDHEYHVQNLLYAILAPIFPDIREEEYLPSVGQKKPRADLFVPTLQVIIEVKYARESMKIQQLIGDISQDCGLYRAQRELMIVPFIWDAGRRIDEHSLLRRGLMELPGIFDAVIVSPPGWLQNSSS